MKITASATLKTRNSVKAVDVPNDDNGVVPNPKRYEKPPVPLNLLTGRLSAASASWAMNIKSEKTPIARLKTLFLVTCLAIATMGITTRYARSISQ